MSPNTEHDARSRARNLGGPGAETLVEDYVARRIDRRQFFGRAAALGLSATSAGTLLAACGGTGASPASGASAEAKTLYWRPAADVLNVDPAILPGLEDPVYILNFYETLIARKPGTKQLVHCLAESFEQSKDGLRFHFTLKQGIPFQKDYGEVQASDVKYSFERIAGLTKPNLHSPFKGDWVGLDHVQVESKYSGTIVMKEIFAPTVISTLPGTSGSVVSQKAAEKLGKKLGTSPVGTGPYEWTSWTAGQKLVMTKFANYGGANKAYANHTRFGEIQALPISSEESAYAALQTGTITLSELGTSVVKQARSNSSIKVWKQSGAGGLYYWLAMNVTEPPLDNIWLRKAIRSAVDVPGIIEDAYSGLYTRVNAILPPASPIGVWTDAPVYNQDFALAKSYLAKSGLKNVTLKLNTDTSQGSVSAAQIIAANLGQIGVKVNVEPVQPATFSDIPGAGGGGAHPQLLYYYYGGNADPNGFLQYWTCPQVGLWNWDHWCNKEFTDLTFEALKTYDDAKRTQLYIEAQKLWDKAAGMVWIASAPIYVGTVHNVVPSFDAVLGQLVPWNTTTT